MVLHFLSRLFVPTHFHHQNRNKTANGSCPPQAHEEYDEGNKPGNVSLSFTPAPHEIQLKQLDVLGLNIELFVLLDGTVKQGLALAFIVL